MEFNWSVVAAVVVSIFGVFVLVALAGAIKGILESRADGERLALGRYEVRRMGKEWMVCRKSDDGIMCYSSSKASAGVAMRVLHDRDAGQAPMMIEETEETIQ